MKWPMSPDTRILGNLNSPLFSGYIIQVKCEQRNFRVGAGEMAQGLKTLLVLQEDLDSIPSIHVAARNCQLPGTQHPHKDIHASKILILIK